MPDHTLPLVNVLFIDRSIRRNDSPTMYVIRDEKLELFYNKFKPVAGSPYNDYICSGRNKFCKSKLKESLNVEIHENSFSIDYLYNHNCKITPLNTHLVFLKIQGFSMTLPKKQDSQNYSFLDWFKSPKPDVSHFTVLLLQKCAHQTKIWTPPKVVKDQLVTFLSPSHQHFQKVKKDSIKHIKNDSNWTKCFCELDSPDKYIQQRPLQFYTKSLLPRIETFNLYSEKNKYLLNLASYYNLATFDIESITKSSPSANLKSHKEIGFFYKLGQALNCETDKQELIMIGMTSTITENVTSWLETNSQDMSYLEIEQTQNSNKTEIFHLANNHLSNRKAEPNFENQTALVAKFIKTIYSQAVVTANVKRKILRPLEKQIMHLKEKHKDLTDAILEFMPRHTSKGFDEIAKLKIAFDVFINEFVLLGFNSSKYDIPLIIPYLKALANNKKDDLFFFKNIKIF